MKIMTIMGTRPEIIRLADIIKLLDKNVDHILVHTGQNYDKNLNNIFFEDLELRLPDYQLQCKANSIEEQIGKILSSTGLIMDKEKPDAILILGDTNSGLSSIIAKRKKIIIFHLEAGDRSFDNDVPEELNRRIIDHTSDVNLAYTENSRDNLFKEGIHPKNIYVVGSPIFEVYNNLKNKFSKSTILKKLCLYKKKYFAASIHREENVDNKKNFKSLIEAVEYMHAKYNLQIVVSTHPRTRKRLEESNYKFHNKSILFSNPFGFIDYNKLQTNAYCVISDSGTISEESSIFNQPSVMIRQAHERPEAMEEGTLIMSGLEKENVINSINIVTTQNTKKREIKLVSDYNVNNVSKKVVRIIFSYTSFVNRVVWQK